MPLKYSYMPPAVPPGEKIALHRPFSRFGAFGFGARMPELSASADSDTNWFRSRYVVYENDHPLGPPHTLHTEIAALGGGRFSHREDVIAFSTSDNTDPNSNGRGYWAVLPKD
jgi:hypothetical protein